MVFIHGSGPGVSAYANWRLTMPVLSAGFRVVAPDLVGFGFTERPRDYVYGMDGWVAHLVGVMDALGIEREFAGIAGPSLLIADDGGDVFREAGGSPAGAWNP